MDQEKTPDVELQAAQFLALQTAIRVLKAIEHGHRMHEPFCVRLVAMTMWKEEDRIDHKWDRRRAVITFSTTSPRFGDTRIKVRTDVQKYGPEGKWYSDTSGTWNWQGNDKKYGYSLESDHADGGWCRPE